MIISKHLNSHDLEPIKASNPMCIMTIDTVQDILSLPVYEQLLLKLNSVVQDELKKIFG